MTQDRFEPVSNRDPHAHEHPSACPDAMQLAAYLEDTLQTADHTAMQQHLAHCADCRAIVGTAMHAQPDAARETVPELWLARARRLAAPRRPQRIPAWAAAATVLFAVGLTVLVSQPAPPGPAETGWETTRGSRLLPERPATPQIIAPLDSDRIAARDLVVRWKAVDAATAYGVRIVDEDGDVVAERRVTGTEWVPDDAVALTANAHYFVRVDAYTSDGRPQSSTHVPFTVTD